MQKQKVLFFPWPKCPWPKCPLAEMSVAKMSRAEMSWPNSLWPKCPSTVPIAGKLFFGVLVPGMVQIELISYSN